MGSPLFSLISSNMKSPGFLPLLSLVILAGSLTCSVKTDSATTRPTTRTWLTMASTVMPTTTSPEECPLGWVDGGHMGCFKFLTDDVKLSWVEAMVACENLDSFLTEPITAEQLEFVTSMAYIEESFTGVQGWWVGLTDLGHEGQWSWQHSQSDASISAWASSCPDTSPHNSRDCAALVSVSVDPARQYDAFFRDYPCNERVHGIKVAPICQRGGGVTTTTATTTTTESTTTTSRAHHIELKGGYITADYASGNVFAVNKNGFLGPVCDDGYDSHEAKVICRQLGYQYYTPTSGSRFGPVPSTFAMDSINCSGSESFLQDCSYS